MTKDANCYLAFVSQRDERVAQLLEIAVIELMIDR